MIKSIAFLLLWPAIALANINIELRPVNRSVTVNDAVDVALYLVSDNQATQYAIAADVVFGWDETKLELLGIDNTGGASVMASFLPTQSSLNETMPPADGDGFYQMLANFGAPVAATPAGTLITTFKFTAIAPAPKGTTISVLSNGGSPNQNTRVLDGYTPNYNVLGSIGSATVEISAWEPEDGPKRGVN